MQRIQPASPPFCLAIKLSLKSNRSTVRGAVHVVVGDSEARPRSECMSGERRGGGGGGGGGGAGGYVVARKCQLVK